jgi:carbonic anhydrase/acetyltransferase-like protein (isoleucine patch superfamily)
MRQLGNLIELIIERVNINLREQDFDAGPYIRQTIPLNRLVKFYAFCGITPQHPLHFHFSRSNLAGSYFLGKCKVDHSILYKSDVRGDELKAKGDLFHFKDSEILIHDDEVIRVKDSYLIKTLVHCYTHDPETLEEFLIQNTVSMHYANIHGSPVEGCFLGPFSTVDLTTIHDCIVGAFAYLQVGELSHQRVEPGKIWVKAGDMFDFSYSFPKKVLDNYITLEPYTRPRGIFVDFVRDRKIDFQKVFDMVHLKVPVVVPRGASVNRYALVKGESKISENVLVAQRAYLDNAWMGKGANAQENCYIINSRLEGNNVMAHGAKIIHARLGKQVFVGFNSFLHGTPDFPLTIGSRSIIMPHTIIDLNEPLTIPEGYIVWGFIRNAKDLTKHSVSIKKLSGVKRKFTLGAMKFHGNGSKFVQAFKHRIEHILEANGAFFDGRQNKGHAQKEQNIDFNIMHPYSKGPLKGLYPSIDIRP